MLRRFVITLLYLAFMLGSAQDFSNQWTGYFSYYNISKVVKGNGKIFAAAENAIFSYDTATAEIQEITSIQGLSGEIISTFDYSETYELLIVGYSNGLIEIKFDNDEEVLSVVDILEKTTIVPNSRGINHFNIQDNLVYIATDYGISVYDLERLEFGDTYFIGNSGEQLRVSETTIFGEFIYAACLDGNGIKKASLLDSNIIDFNNWQTVTTGNFVAIETASDQLYAINTSRKIYRITNDTLSELITYPSIPVELTYSDTYLLAVLNTGIFIYDKDFGVVGQVPVSPDFSTIFNTAVADSDQIYIGTRDFGGLKTSLSTPSIFEEIRPDGPLLNNAFAIQAASNGVWVTFGAHDIELNPYPLNSRGISYLDDEDWLNIPFEELLGARELKPIVVNPFKNDQVFIGSYFDGLLEINNKVPTILYDENNSGLDYFVIESIPDYIGDIRIANAVFDENGLLWTTTNFVDPAINSYNPETGNWQSYSIEGIVPKNNNGYPDLVIGNDGTKWIATWSYGLAAMNELKGEMKIINREENNLPINYVSALAIDKRNQLWIGTIRGLRVLYNTSNFFEDDDAQAEEIIILDDGEAQELLFQQQITDIKVDGSNNKWIGTGDSGLFYLSSDGQETIFHFTTDNSPLPSNLINDISIDDVNGIVYIATGRGLVSFKSGSSRAFDDLEKAYVYPNPVRPQFDIVEQKVKIKDISENVNIKITDIEGNLVAEAQSRTNLRYNGYNLEIDGGTAYWNGKNMANNVVASGVYLIMLSDLDTYETKVLKLMVVR